MLYGAVISLNSDIRPNIYCQARMPRKRHDKPLLHYRILAMFLSLSSLSPWNRTEDWSLTVHMYSRLIFTLLRCLPPCTAAARAQRRTRNIRAAPARRSARLRALSPFVERRGYRYLCCSYWQEGVPTFCEEAGSMQTTIPLFCEKRQCLLY